MTRVRESAPVLDRNRKLAKKDIAKYKEERKCVKKRNKSLDKFEQELRKKLKSRREANENVQNTQ